MQQLLCRDCQLWADGRHMGHELRVPQLGWRKGSVRLEPRYVFLCFTDGYDD